MYKYRGPMTALYRVLQCCNGLYSKPIKPKPSIFSTLNH